MILVVGGTGRMGSLLVDRLVDRGEQVRVLSRNPVAAPPNGVEYVRGDLRDPESVARALRGVGTVVAAAHGFAGRDGVSPATIDWQGNLTLIRAAESAGVGHFVLISVLGVSASHPMDLFQMKARAEDALKESSLQWTIIRASAFMETWMQVVGEALIRSGKTRVFGRGRNPINFVSASDVADDVAEALRDPSLRGKVVEIGGPEDLSWDEFTRVVQEVSGRRGKVNHVPLPMLRAMSIVIRPLNATMARQVIAAVVMDTTDMSLEGLSDPRAVRRTGKLRLADVVRRDYVDVSQTRPVLQRR